MFDQEEKIYNQLLRLAIEKNIVANCREYPSLTYGGQSVRPHETRRFLGKKFGDPRVPIGLYAHFPFCRSRCTFCKYYSEVIREDAQLDDFLAAFSAELDLYEVNFTQKKLENLFLGGGTPTLLDPERMALFLDGIEKHFVFRKDAQKTIEGSPESLSRRKVMLYKERGINRISLGMQSSNDHVLRAVGRRHTVKDAFRAFELIREAGIAYIGTELIWGLPQESRASYRKTVADLIKLAPDFIEGYLLTAGGRTKVSRYCPDDITLQGAVDMAKEQLISHGYDIAFEGNCIGFVKKGTAAQDALNQNTDSLYRHRACVFGVGPGASTHFQERKHLVASNLENYHGALSRGRLPEMIGINIPAEEYKRHYIISQIGFFGRVSKADYQELFGKRLREDFPQELFHMEQKGVVQEAKETYVWDLGDLCGRHEKFYTHVLQYWYSKRYTRWIIKRYLNKRGS